MIIEIKEGNVAVSCDGCGRPFEQGEIWEATNVFESREAALECMKIYDWTQNEQDAHSAYCDACSVGANR